MGAPTNPGPIASFVTAEAIDPGIRVKLNSSNQVAIAGAGEMEIGINLEPVASGGVASVQLNKQGGTVSVVAASAFAIGALLVGVASGKVDDAGIGPAMYQARQAATAAGDQIEAVYVGQSYLVTVPIRWGPGRLDGPDFIADRPHRVVNILARQEAAEGGALTLTIKKAASGTAISGGTPLHSGTINCNTTTNTNQAVTLSATSSDLDIAAGTAIGADFSTTITTGTGVALVFLIPSNG
ncbi:MAG: hypothetical protein AB7O32_00165 [Vicinamibacterales bacterium]